jgi:hypothetical protein
VLNNERIVLKDGAILLKIVLNMLKCVTVVLKTIKKGLCDHHTSPWCLKRTAVLVYPRYKRGPRTPSAVVAFAQDLAVAEPYLLARLEAFYRGFGDIGGI